MGQTLAAELERHRDVERELSGLASAVAAEHDTLGLRDIVLTARTDAYTLGMNLGAAVTAQWFMREMVAFIESPHESFQSFVERITAELNEAFE